MSALSPSSATRELRARRARAQPVRVRVARMVDRVLLAPDELARSLQNVARVRLQRDVDPELLIAAPAGLLAGNAIEAGHEVERLAERLSGIVGQRRVR